MRNPAKIYSFIRKRLGISITLLLLLTLNNLYGQASMSVDVPRVVESGESFRLVFTVNAEATNFTLPQLPDFDILAGPSQSRMSSVQVINGKRTESIQISFTYVLQAKREGKFTIPGASVSVEGKTITSSQAGIEVIKGDSSVKKVEGDSQSTGVDSEDIFLKLSVSKSRVVKGEHLIATLKLYTRVPIAGFEDVRFPPFNGFWSQEVETPQNVEFVRESVDGKIYNAALLRRYLLLPQQSGTLTIDPAEMVCKVQVRTATGSSRSIFDDFFDSYRSVSKRVSTSAIRVVVDPLPAGAPSSFGGAVGEFSMSAKLSKDSVNANEALSMIINIAGTGNINLIEAPVISFPPGFELYDVKITDNSSKGARGASGSKAFEYPIIPRGPGEYIVSPVEFSYYDINKKRYVILTSKEFKIKVGQDVSGVAGHLGGTLPFGVTQQAVRSITDDIRYIHTASPLLRRGALFFFGSYTYFILLLLLPVFGFILEWLLSKRVERNRDVAGKKSRRANKIARQRLKKAELLLKQRLYSAFYEELHKAVLGYISDKLNFSLSDLSRDKIKEELLLRKVGDEHTEEFLSLLEQCEYARYAPDPGDGEMDKNYTRAIKLISEMEL